MGQNDKGKTSVDNKHNKLGISAGLVAQRRKELIAAKLLGLGGIGSNPIPEVNYPSVVENQSEEKMRHLTKSRPMFKQHRPPSRLPRQVRHELADLTTLLNKTIADATAKYRDYYLNGVNTLEPNGWFSWWRHRMYGQNKAKEVNEQVQKYDTINCIMTRMDLLFTDPFTQYDHHSYATYLLREFDKLLKHLSLPGCKPSEGGHYDKNSWFFVAAQLQKLIPPERKQDDCHEDERDKQKTPGIY